MNEIEKYPKWVEWSDEDQVFIGKCPDLITGIHGDDPVASCGELLEVLAEVVTHFQQERRPLPPEKVRLMREVA
jgi:predicted RNase H-like HicB family nuclease